MSQSTLTNSLPDILNDEEMRVLRGDDCKDSSEPKLYWQIMDCNPNGIIFGVCKVESQSGKYSDIINDKVLSLMGGLKVTNEFNSLLKVINTFVDTSGTNQVFSDDVAAVQTSKDIIGETQKLVQKVLKTQQTSWQVEILHEIYRLLNERAKNEAIVNGKDNAEVKRLIVALLCNDKNDDFWEVFNT